MVRWLVPARDWVVSWVNSDPDPEQLQWHKKPLSVVMLYVFLLLLWYWEIHIPLPGKAVTSLAVAAAVVTFRGEEMRGKEKLAWLVLFFAFLKLELSSIDQERKASEYIRSVAVYQEAQSFNKIAGAIQHSVEAITGGDSFLYVAPQPTEPIRLLVWNHGDNQLTGTMTIFRTGNPAKAINGIFNPIKLGTIGPHDGIPAPIKLSPEVSPSRPEDFYSITLAAQNGSVTQLLGFRRSKRNPKHWEHRYEVVR